MAVNYDMKPVCFPPLLLRRDFIITEMPMLFVTISVSEPSAAETMPAQCVAPLMPHPVRHTPVSEKRRRICGMRVRTSFFRILPLWPYLAVPLVASTFEKNVVYKAVGVFMFMSRSY